MRLIWSRLFHNFDQDSTVLPRAQGWIATRRPTLPTKLPLLQTASVVLISPFAGWSAPCYKLHNLMPAPTYTQNNTHPPFPHPTPPHPTLHTVSSYLPSSHPYFRPVESQHDCLFFLFWLSSFLQCSTLCLPLFLCHCPPTKDDPLGTSKTSVFPSASPNAHMRCKTSLCSLSSFFFLCVYAFLCLCSLLR